MKYTGFDINGNHIEFHNSIFGEETVLANRKIISKKFSIFGTSHKFDLERKQYEIKSKLQPFTGSGIELELLVDGKIAEVRLIKNIKQSIVWFTIGLLFSLALNRIWR